MPRPPIQPVDADQRLLLYAAGELPPRDAADLRRQLDHDAGLRDRLEEVRDAMNFADEAIRRIDAADPLPAPAVTRAAGRAARAVADWQDAPAAVAGQIGPEPMTHGRAWKIARWPLSVAAALVVGLIAWTLFSDPAATTVPPTLAFNADGRFSPDGVGPGRRGGGESSRWRSDWSGQDESPPPEGSPEEPATPDVTDSPTAVPSAADRAVALFEDPADGPDALAYGDYRDRLAALRRVADDDWAAEDGW